MGKTRAERERLKLDILEDRTNGLGVEEIAKKRNCSKNTVSKYLKEDNPVPNKEARAKDIIDKLVKNYEKRNEIIWEDIETAPSPTLKTASINTSIKNDVEFISLCQASGVLTPDTINVTDQSVKILRIVNKYPKAEVVQE